jgi:hypothetical protein
LAKVEADLLHVRLPASTSAVITITGSGRGAFAGAMYWAGLGQRLGVRNRLPTRQPLRWRIWRPIGPPRNGRSAA